MSFDSYGQLTEMNWPRVGFNKKYNFSNKEVVFKIAEKFAKRHLFKTKKRKSIDLEYNLVDDKFYWKVTFYQGSKLFNSKKLKYKTIIIDPKTETIINSYTNYKSISHRTCSGISF